MGSVNKKRCFAFGCSYTEFIWPTMADMIGINFDEYYNFGMSGSDNSFALSKLIDTNDIFQLNPETDLVVFGVTGLGRFTYWDKKCQWIAQGDYNFISNKYFPASTDKVLSVEKFCPPYAVYRSVNAVNAFKLICDSLKIKSIIWPAIDNATFCTNHVYQTDLPVYAEYAIEKTEKMIASLDAPESLDEFMFKNFYLQTPTIFINENHKETHPHPTAHLAYLKKYFPEQYTDKSQALCNTFSNKSYKSHLELKEKMMNFIISHRQDYKLDISYDLRFFKGSFTRFTNNKPDSL